MILPLPEHGYTSVEVLASWLELSALSENCGFVTRGAALESLRDSGLYAEAQATSGESRDNSTEGTSASILELVWATLVRRARLLADAWPFQLQQDRLDRRSEKQNAEDVAAYCAMLLLEAAGAKWYKAIAIESGDPIRKWFEYIVVVAIGHVTRGKIVRFGAPFPTDWPTSFPEQIGRLALEFGVASREVDIAEHASPDQQDDSLDVVARLWVADEEPSAPFILVQCATGANWKSDKPAEPRMDLWREYVSWNGPTYKALAIPFALREKGMLADASLRHGNALIFDRLRIAAGDPDRSIDSQLRSDLAGWCGKRFEMLFAPPIELVTEPKVKTARARVRSKKASKRR